MLQSPLPDLSCAAACAAGRSAARSDPWRPGPAARAIHAPRQAGAVHPPPSGAPRASAAARRIAAITEAEQKRVIRRFGRVSSK